MFFWEAFQDTLFKHPIRTMMQAIQMLHTAINTYHEYEGENKKHYINILLNRITH